MNDLIQLIETVTLNGVSDEKKYIKKLEQCIDLYKSTKLEALLLKFKDGPNKAYDFLLLTKFVILYTRSS